MARPSYKEKQAKELLKRLLTNKKAASRFDVERIKPFIEKLKKPR